MKTDNERALRGSQCTEIIDVRIRGPGAPRIAARPQIFLTLAADGAAEPADQRSSARRLLTLAAIAVLLLTAPLYWATIAEGSEGQEPVAVVSKSSDDESEDEARVGRRQRPGRRRERWDRPRHGG
jgi:hypothetical protein